LGWGCIDGFIEAVSIRPFMFHPYPHCCAIQSILFNELLHAAP